MKLVITFLYLAAGLSAQAEMQFPEFETLPTAVQKAWGYTVHRNEGSDPSITIEISAKAAPFCQGARLYIRNKEKGLLAEVNIAPWKGKENTLGFTLKLFEELDGDAELIIYTEEMPDPSIPLTKGGFGGFTFKLSKGFKKN